MCHLLCLNFLTWTLVSTAGFAVHYFTITVTAAILRLWIVTGSEPELNTSSTRLTTCAIWWPLRPVTINCKVKLEFIKWPCLCNLIYLLGHGWVLHGSSSRERPIQLMVTSVKSFDLSPSQDLVLNLLPVPHCSVQLPHSDHEDQVILIFSTAVRNGI